jgi:hypothetical protein
MEIYRENPQEMVNMGGGEGDNHQQLQTSMALERLKTAAYLMQLKNG